MVGQGSSRVFSREYTLLRVSNRVLQSRNPNPKFREVPHDLEVYSGIPPPTHTFNPESRPVFKIPNLELQIREIPDPEKPIGDHIPSVGPQVFIYLFIYLLQIHSTA